MSNFPSRETLTVAFASEPTEGLSDKSVIESVVGMTNAEGGTIKVNHVVGRGEVKARAVRHVAHQADGHCLDQTGFVHV